jgi:cytochrome c-type biogenesis protein CcmE
MSPIMNLKQTKWIIGLTFIAIGVGIVVATTLPKSTQYYVTVDELLKNHEEFSGKELKVAGKVAAGSVLKDDKTHTWDFRVENANQVVAVSFRGAMPDTFKEGADVVVTGRYNPDGHVTATNVLAKCASRYEEKLKPSY